MTPLLSYLLAGTLGVFFHIFVIKIPSLRDKSKRANHPFTFKDYLADDWHSIAGSFISIGILIIGLKEVLALKPEFANYITWIFVFVGFTGSSLIQSIFSIANKKIMQVIDVKTNIADGIEPPVTEDNAEGAKEILKEEGNG